MWMIFEFLLVFFLNTQEDKLLRFVGMRWGVGGMVEVTSSHSFSESQERRGAPVPRRETRLLACRYAPELGLVWKRRVWVGCCHRVAAAAF